MPQAIEFTFEQGDVTNYDADVVALKYAQHFYGSDKAVAEALRRVNVRDDNLQPPVGKYRYVETRRSIKADHVLFVGTVPLTEFRYQHIHHWALQVLEILADEAPQTQHIVATVHGSGFGLDEAEACRSEFAGFIDALQAGNFPTELERITLISSNEERVQRFRKILDELLVNADYAKPIGGRWGYRLVVQPLNRQERTKAPASAAVSESVDSQAKAKSHAFIAMPFKKEMDDVFYYGVEKPVHDAGLLCERVDKSAFTGGIMDYVKNRIETASVVIAELTEANPNVYLEVGYAWGKGRPTILLSKNEEALHFDVKGQKCLVYERIKDLEEGLAKELKGMIAKGIIQVNHAR